MSKFRNKKAKTTLEVCGKVPIQPVWSGVREMISNIGYNIKNECDLDIRKACDDYQKFEHNNNEGRAFFSVTKASFLKKGKKLSGRISCIPFSRNKK